MRLLHSLLTSVFYLISALHLSWAIILLTTDIPLHITSIQNIWGLFHSFKIAGLIFLVSSFFAFYVLKNANKPSFKKWQSIGLLPQQFLIIWGAIGVIICVYKGHYADGDVHNSLFIFADQLIYILLAIFHVFAYICLSYINIPWQIEEAYNLFKINTLKKNNLN